MGKKSAPSAPQPVDPYEVARADAEFNRIDQYTPAGSLTFSGPNRNQANLEFSPEVQALFDQQLGLDSSMLGSSAERLAMMDPNQIDLSQFGPIQSNIDREGLGFTSADLSGMPGLNMPNFGTVGEGPNLQGAANFAGPNFGIQQGIEGVNLPTFGSDATVQQGIDFSNLPGIPQDFGEFRNRVEDSVFQRGRRLMEPQFARQEAALRDTLANQGLPGTSEAFLDQQDQFNTNRNSAYADLADRSVLLGGQEASRQFANSLAGRQQGVGEILSQGQFANQAAGQQFGQDLSRFGADMGAANAQFGQNLAQGQFGNQAANQDLSRALATFGVGQQQAGFNNQAAQQGFQNQLAGQGFNNQAGAMQLGAEQGIRGQLSGEQFNLANSQNAANAQELGLRQQMLANQNAARTMGLNEQIGIRGNAFNELASLLGLQQVQQPSMQNFFAPGQADFMGAQALNAQQQQNAYQGALMQQQGALGGLSGLGGALLGGMGAAAGTDGGLIGGFKG
jgi:hypothetical protein